MEERSIPAQIRYTANGIKNFAGKRLANYPQLQITGAEGLVLGFIFRHYKDNVSARDVINRFGTSKATVSETLSNLERKGYIAQNVSPLDARAKIICLTPLGEEIKKKFDIFFTQADSVLLDGFSTEEKKEFKRLLNKLEDNLKKEGGCLCQSK